MFIRVSKVRSAVGQCENTRSCNWRAWLSVTSVSSPCIARAAAGIARAREMKHDTADLRAGYN